MTQKIWTLDNLSGRTTLLGGNDSYMGVIISRLTLLLTAKDPN